MTPAVDDPPRAALLTRLAFGLAVALLIARCLMLETVRDVDAPAAGVPSGPGAATSVVLDWLSLVPALLILIRRLADRSFTLRFGACHWLAFALAGWAVLSTAWADDRFLALVTSMRLVAAVSLFWSMTQLVRRWDHLRIVAGVALGLLLANVAQGALYRGVEFADLKSFWEQNKAQVFQDRGWQPGDYVAARFEQKLLAGEILGFNSSPNALAAIVVMASIVGLGAFAQRVADRDEPGWAGVVGLAALSGLYLLANAGSKAAWGAYALGVALLVIGGAGRRWIAGHRALLLSVLAVGIALTIVTVVGVGLSRGNLFEASLTFRWRYWLGAWPIFLAHPVAGVGWSNFADHYLATRLPEATEEINDPHNALVRLAVELGVVGLALGVASATAWTLRATARMTADVAAPSPPPRVGLKGVLVACGFALLLSLASALDFSAGDDGYLIYEAMKRCLFVGLVALAIAAVAIRSAADAHVDARPAPWIATGLLAGVAMLGLMSMIDVTLFQTGPLMLVAVIAGALAGLRWRDRPPRADSLPLVALIVGGLGWVVMAVIVVAPVALAEYYARSGDQAIVRRNARQSWFMYQRAASMSPVRNADYKAREADAFARYVAGVTGDFDMLPEYTPRLLYDRAIAANPSRVAGWLARSRFLLSQQSVTAEDARRAVDDFGRAVALNPNDVDLRVEYADLLERVGRRADAAAQIVAALAVDDAMDPAEPERLRLRAPGRYEQLRARLATLRQATTPAT